MKFDLQGCYDLHVHTAPDTGPRAQDDLELAQSMTEAGMAGCVLKCHSAPTAGRAGLVRKLFPGFAAVGSVTLNRGVGGLNPAAVEAAGRMGARYLWMPTMDARSYMAFNKKPDAPNGLTVLSADGTLKEEAVQVIDTAIRYDMVVATGHLGPEESLAVLRCGAERGAKRLCVTHATLPACWMTEEQLRIAAECGAFVEYSYEHILSGKCPWEYAVGQIRMLGAEHVILSTDLGQVHNPHAVQGLQAYADRLLESGFSREELDRMLRQNPHTLLFGTIS